MKIAVLVNNYNYERFLRDCLDSVIGQTRKADEIIVVDDGSTDGSMALLASIAGSCDVPITVIDKRNGGQLSAFNAGFKAVTADVVCFLDSDDLYDPHYLAQVEMGFVEYPGTSLFYSSYIQFFTDGSRKPFVFEDGGLPLQLLQTICLHRFCGAPTSMIAVRRDALARILPCDDEPSWRVSADDVLVMLSAALRLDRRHTRLPLVMYRIHGGNNFQGKKPTPAAKRARRAARTRLLARFSAQFEQLPVSERIAAYREEASMSPKTAVMVFRLLLLVFVLPVPIAARASLLLAFVRWLLRTG